MYTPSKRNATSFKRAPECSSAMTSVAVSIISTLREKATMFQDKTQAHDISRQNAERPECDFIRWTVAYAVTCTSTSPLLPTALTSFSGINIVVWFYTKPLRKVQDSIRQTY